MQKLEIDLRINRREKEMVKVRIVFNLRHWMKIVTFLYYRFITSVSFECTYMYIHKHIQFSYHTYVHVHTQTHTVLMCIHIQFSYHTHIRTVLISHTYTYSSHIIHIHVQFS